MLPCGRNTLRCMEPATPMFLRGALPFLAFAVLCANCTGQTDEKPPAPSPKAGLVISQAGEFTHESVTQAFRLAAESGAGITRYYTAWADIEKQKGVRDWKGCDYMIGQVRSAKLRLSVALHTIHTAVRGAMPSDLVFKGWDDGEFTALFGDFALAFLDRYADVVDFVEIGSEVNAYFSRHPEEVGAYRTFFETVRRRIKGKHPRVGAGIVFAWSEMKTEADREIYRRLAIGDHDGFTLYLFGDNFAHTREPAEILQSLKEIEKLTGTRRFALEEVGWSPWPGLKSSEADQAAAVGYFFDYLESAPERLEFMTWFNLHDGREEDYAKIVQSFVAGQAMADDPEAVRCFTEFLCHLGLRAHDGTPRAAWHEWVKRAGARGRK